MSDPSRLRAERRDIPNPNRLEGWNYCNPCCGGCLVFLLLVLCVVLAASKGWYYVHYKNVAAGPVYCYLSLSDCTLASCHETNLYTGYAGEGDCSSWSYALVMFVLAAVYAGLYLAFMAGVFHMQHKNWVPYMGSGRYSGCCIDTSLDLGEACPGRVCDGIGPCAGVLPHGVLGLPVPIFMFWGFVMVLNQDLSHFGGVDAGFSYVFYLALLITICSFCVTVGLMYDATSSEFSSPTHPSAKCPFLSHP